jgi:hypothetical protein
MFQNSLLASMMYDITNLHELEVIVYLIKGTRMSRLCMTKRVSRFVSYNRPIPSIVQSASGLRSRESVYAQQRCFSSWNT